MSLPENVIPISAGYEWTPLSINLPDKRPRIAAGSYQGQVATLQKKHAYGRDTLELGFDVWRGQAFVVDGTEYIQDKLPPPERLARVPLFMPWPPKRPSPNSQIARLFYLMGRTRHESVNVSALRGRWFYVEVADQEHDSKNRPYSPEETYSIITRVVRYLG